MALIAISMNLAITYTKEIFPIISKLQGLLWVVLEKSIILSCIQQAEFSTVYVNHEMEIGREILLCTGNNFSIEPGMLKLQGWINGMGLEWGQVLTVFIGVMTLIRNLLWNFIGY